MGRVGSNAIGHFRVRARQLTPPALTEVRSVTPIGSPRTVFRFSIRFTSKTRTSQQLVLRRRARAGGTSRQTDSPIAVVAGHVSHGGGLLLHTRLSTRHCLSRSRRVVSAGNAHSLSLDTVRSAAHLQSGCRKESARARQHFDARRSAATLARQSIRSRAAGICSHGLRNHCHPVCG